MSTIACLRGISPDPQILEITKISANTENTVTFKLTFEINYYTMPHDRATEQTRSSRLTIRLTYDELNEIESKADRAGLTNAEYARQNILGRQVTEKTLVPLINQKAYNDLAQMAIELRKQGTNLNQIAKLVNSYPDLRVVWDTQLESAMGMSQGMLTSIEAIQSKLLGLE